MNKRKNKVLTSLYFFLSVYHIGNGFAAHQLLQIGNGSILVKMDGFSVQLGLGLGLWLWLGRREPKVGGLSHGFWAACGHAGTPHFLGPRDSFAENGPAEVTLGLTDQKTGGKAGC